MSRFLPLESPFEVLIGLLDQLEGVVTNQPDFEDIATELTTISRSVRQHLDEASPVLRTDCAINIVITIQQHLKDVKECDRDDGITGRGSEKGKILGSYRLIQGLLQKLQANANLSTWLILNEHLANTRLDSLYSAKQAAFDSSLSTEINRRSCTEGTRVAVLAGLDEWLQNPVSPAIYWMNGMAGTGKTTIASTFCERVERRKLLAASFFCTRSSAECRNVSRIIPTIAYQFARYSIPYQSALCQVLAQNPDIGSRTLSGQFKLLLKVPLQQVQDTLPDRPVIVIDALDECDDRNGVELMLEALFLHAPQVPLKFLVTSRPEPEIHTKMSLHSRPREVLQLHELEKSLVQADIELYLTKELAFMSPSPTDIEQLVQRSGPLFIYAATLVRYIRPGKQSVDPYKRLRSLLGAATEGTKRHTHIDALYMTILRAAMKEDEHGTNQAEDIKRVLHVVVLAQEPVSNNTISKLGNIDGIERVNSALQFLRSVVHQSETTGLVSILHASFADFMFNKERSGSYFCDVAQNSPGIFSVAYSPDGTRVAVGCGDNTVRILNAHDGTLLLEPLQGHTSWVSSVVFSPDGQLVASGSEDKHIRVWNAYTGALVLGSLKGHSNVCSISFSPDGTRIVSGSWDKFIRIWSTSEGTLLQDPFGHDSDVNAVAFSPDGTLIASGSDDRTVRLWNSADGTPAASPFEGHTEYVMSVAFTPDGTLLVSGSNNIRVWNISDGSLATDPLEGHTLSALSVAVSPDGMRVASGSQDCTVRVWRIEDGKLAAGPFIGHTSSIRSVAYSPDGTRVISGSKDGTIRLWNVRDGLLNDSPPAHHPVTVISSLIFHADGTHVLSDSHDNTFVTWDILDGTFTKSSIEGQFCSTVSSVLSPNGAYIASFSKDRGAQVLHAKDFSLVAGPFQSNRVSSIRFLQDNTSLVIGSEDGDIQIRDLQSGDHIVSPLVGHKHAVTSLASSPDSSCIVSYSKHDKTLRVWTMLTPTLGIPTATNSSFDSPLDGRQANVFKGWDVREDGWVTNSNGHLLFWLPTDIAVARPSPRTSLIITKSGVLKIPEQKLLVGDEWWKCFAST